MLVCKKQMLAERLQPLAMFFLFVWLLKSNETVIWTLKKKKKKTFENRHIKAQRKDDKFVFFYENLNLWNVFDVKVSKVLFAFKSHTVLFPTFATKDQEMKILSTWKI